MREQATVLGPLVNVAALEAKLGTACPSGEVMLWDCGCALRYDRGELAWRYAARCVEHDES